ncbi:MAG TPA: nucleotidyltransferase family protein [Chloroflexia bacterium]|nr:nucleotidyltransferase family protein [Chloroflexia bacterium]
MDEARHVQKLESILRADAWFMDVLATVRDADPPDWLVGAGVIRTIVWDHLHGYAMPTSLADVDVAFFDAADLSPARDAAVQADLATRRPTIPWEATNQAAVHLWYGAYFGTAVDALPCSAAAVATWPETATSVAVRLQLDDSLTIVAPCGLADLLGLVLRHNPRRATAALYLRRVEQKQIARRWPRVHTIPPT